MVRRLPVLLVSLPLIASCNQVAPIAKAPAPSCGYDRTSLLALDQVRFDQDPKGGWRALAAKPGCQLAAADLLRDYRQTHSASALILYWHEGQLRANAGQSAEAVALMEKARKRVGEDGEGWNIYVDATVAFLRRDRPALENARKRLAAIPPPMLDGQSSFKDGYIDAKMADGQLRKLRWPMNLDVVEALLRCLDKPYQIAYSSSECRPAGPPAGT
jgi:hypothetical protein